MSAPASENPTSLQPDWRTGGSNEAAAQALQQLDERLIHLRDNVFPPQPYLLSVPTDSPFRFHRAFLNTWHAGTPFGPHEEQLQYMSFHLHQNLGEDLLKVVGGWSDTEGNLMEDDSYSQTLSAQTTPVQLPSRKKISLKDYKTKDKSHHATPVTAASTGTGTISASSKQTMKADVKAPEGKHGENHKSSGDANRKAGQSGSKSEVVASTAARLSNKQPHPTVRAPDSPSPPKRRRLSLEDSRSDEARVKTGEKDGKKKTLPTLLSPTMPAADKRRTSRELPALLSPKLPATLEKVLADNLPKRTEQVKAILGPALGSLSGKKPAAKPAPETGRPKADGQVATKSLPSSVTASPKMKPVSSVGERSSTPIPNGVQPSPRPRQRHIVVLKYGKKNRRRVEALLKFAPRARKTVRHPEEVAVRKAADPIREAGKTAMTPIKAEKKRLPEPSPERPVKKLKPAVETPERPRTPLSVLRSPAAPSSARRPDVQVTPRKELKPSAMQRITSTDGLDAPTPPLERGRTSTPVSVVPARESPAPSSSSTVRDADRAAWNELNTKFFALGRQLKRDAQALATSRSESEQTLSLIHNIEALLCFMINLSAQSHSRPSVDPGWETIIPYFIFVFKASRRHRHLHGLVIQLGAICRQIWHNHNIDRLHRDPLPDESCTSAPTPGSDGNTKTDDGERYKKKYLEFKASLVQNSRELQLAWLDGSRYLSPSQLEQEYPRTWNRRTKDTNRRGQEKIRPGNIDETFYLPLDPNSNVFEASRFAVALLEEWCDRERIAWKSKIEL